MIGQAAIDRRAMLRLGVTAGAVAAALPWRAALAETLDPRVAALVRQTIGIDTHNHVDVQLDPAGSASPDLDLAGELKRSGLSAICMTFAVDYKTLDRPGEAHARFLKGLDVMDAQLRRNGLRRAFTLADIRRAHAARRPTVIQSVEGCHFLEGRVERLNEAYARGLRHLGILHDRDANPALGDVYTNPPRFGGLSPLGKDTIRAANRLGMLVDMAHGSADTVRDTLALSTTPILVSHTGLDSRLGDDARMGQMMRPRLIAADLARSVAQAGGVIGVWSHLAASPIDYAHNIRAMVDIVGVDHVCIGTDTKLTPAFYQGNAPSPDAPPRPNSRPGERTNEAWADQRDGFYYAVVDALLRAGFTADEIGRIGGGNYCRLFDAATQGKARAAKGAR